MRDFKQLFSAFDYIDEVIYICDMETYDLVYCNRKLEGNLLTEYHPNQSGYKCYQCLHGLDHPCVFCNNDTLRKEKRCIWSRLNPNDGRYYLLHDSLIEIDGKEYRMELAVDATHLEEGAALTREKLEIETHLTDCVRQLVKSADFSQAVSAVLQTILNYYGGERAYIFELNYEKQTADNTFEICIPGIHPEKENLQNVPLENMRRWIDHFQRKSIMVIEDLENLKGLPEHEVEYGDLSVQGIRSLIAVPILSEEGIAGFVGVDNPSMNLENTDFMVELAYFLGAEIGKQDSLRQLQDLSYRDALTNVFNRKGLEQVVKVCDDLPYAFMIIDIDHFKLINDTYGHSTGDEILKNTAHLLESVFRSDDAVFRLGGDEFAVLLRNCRPDAWKTICTKIQWVHTSLGEVQKKTAVTLSVGICFFDGTYNEDIYRLADEAMYDAKQNGRAGCTMIDRRTGEKQYWKDDTLSAYSRSVLNINSTGLYRIEYPLDQQAEPKMFCSSEAREIFGFLSDADFETCYRLWQEGIEQTYVEVLHEARQKLKTNVQVECTYRWNHPKEGMIRIRSTGIGEVRDGIQVIYGYHHSMKDTHIVEKKEESQLLLEATSSIYFGSYYINLDNDTYRTIKYAPNERFLKVEEKDAQNSLLNFVSVLAQESDHEKMNRFVDLSTIRQRMANETHLDCEYYAVVEKKYCRATFIPVKHHEDGTLSHVLFEVAPLDYNRAKEARESAQNRRSIESLYDHVPGGLVLYEWDGQKLHTVHASRFYGKIYGDDSLVTTSTTISAPNFDRVHPDDLPGFKAAVRKALEETHHLEYVYRGYNTAKQDYVWIRISAVSEIQSDGTSLIYAMFADVTEKKEADLRLAKKHDSLVAALRAFNQLYYEYDPVTHIEECLTDDAVFHMPKIIENYPEAIMDYVHPDDRDTLRNAISAMEQGCEEMSFSIRLNRDGNYVWYAYHLQTLFDTELNRSIVSISLMDNTEHMRMDQNYRARMNIMLGSTEDALSCGSVNLSRNTFEVIRTNERDQRMTKESASLDELFASMAEGVVGEKEKAEFRRLFSREHLIELMKQGQMHVSMDHMYRISKQSPEWLRTSVDMLVNPESGDIVGVCYAKSIQQEKISNILLEMTLRHDYPLAAIVESQGDRYYQYDPKRNEYGKEKTGFWKEVSANLARVMDKKTADRVQLELSKDHILKELNHKNYYSYAFNTLLHGESHRMEVGFYYTDDSREMIVATLRDITDSVIMERLRHDNERDHLTDLYNRRKVFAKCKELLYLHPEDTFAMLHFDIRHFRLYNTYFGDKAGDKLLCDIADMFRNMDKDYDYWAYGRIEADVFCVFFPISQNKYQKHLDDLLNGLQDYRSDFLIEPAIGIYTVTDRTMSIESMFTRASIAAKTVRSGVTNAVIFYDETMEQALVDEQEVINDMQAALENGQFKVYLQPQYSLKTHSPIGAEALVRWIHPQKGLVSPAKFIPIFERNGFIANLDRYMWENVCRLLKTWQDEGRKIQPVSVNVSRISMYNPTTVQYLKELVERYGLDPRYLELELTESAYMDDPSEIKKYLRELRDYGFHILMDDFGSGYSSLNTLRELPVDVLKLDKEFLSESSGDERGRLVLSSVVQMSRMMNLNIIAEGVETESQADFLRGLGVEFVQGYLFARPMPSEEYEQQLFGNKENHS